MVRFLFCDFKISVAVVDCICICISFLEGYSSFLQYPFQSQLAFVFVFIFLGGSCCGAVFFCDFEISVAVEDCICAENLWRL